MIITQDDINALCRQCSTDEDSVLNMISEAETLDVLPLLGTALFEAVSATPSDFLPLLDGCTYYDLKGRKRSHQGLKKCLAYYASSRIIRSGNGVMTQYGYVVKYNDSSTPADFQRLANDSNYLRDVANQYAEQIKGYLKAVAKTELYKDLISDPEEEKEDNGFIHSDLIGD